MARIPLQDPQTATGPVKEVFDGFNKALGVVPNMTRAMANSPAVLRAYAQFNAALSAGTLPAPIREQISLVVAESNACAYCLSAHSAIGKMLGLKPAQLDAARQGQSEDPRTGAALTFAQAVIDARGGVGESDLRAARSAGLTDAQLAEIVAAVALNTFTNYFNRAFDVDVDFPLVEPRAHATAS